MIGKKDVDNVREAVTTDKKEVLTLISHCLATHQVNDELELDQYNLLDERKSKTCSFSHFPYNL